MRLFATTVFVLYAAAAAIAAEDRGFVQGIVGLTFGTEASSAVAGGVILPVTDNFHIAAEIGRLQNIASNDARDEADRAERAVEESFVGVGFPLDINSGVTTPAFYAMAGGRYTASRGRARPFVGASAGFARISPDFRLSFALDDSDITSQAIEAGFLNVEKTTRFLGTAGVGVTIDGGPSVALEAGYTWMRIFARRSTNLSRAYGAISFRF